MPEWPATSVALLEALDRWVRAEANDVRGKASPTSSDASTYADALEQWAGNISVDKKDTAIPRFRASLRSAARAVGQASEDRLELAILLYRKEYKAALSLSVLSSQKAEKPRRRRTGHGGRTCRQDVELACEVRRHVSPPPSATERCYLGSQAVGLPEYATREEQVDVMLVAIAEGRQNRLVKCSHWETSPFGKAVALYEALWLSYRTDRPGSFPQAFRFDKRRLQDSEGFLSDKELIASLGKVRAGLKRIVDAKEQLQHWRVFNQMEEEPQDASFRAREANYQAAREMLPQWHQDGRCPCTESESCGADCANYTVGAQAAW